MEERGAGLAKPAKKKGYFCHEPFNATYFWKLGHRSQCLERLTRRLPDLRELMALLNACNWEEEKEEEEEEEEEEEGGVPDDQDS